MKHWHVGAAVPRPPALFPTKSPRGSRSGELPQRCVRGVRQQLRVPLRHRRRDGVRRVGLAGFDPPLPSTAELRDIVVWIDAQYLSSPISRSRPGPSSATWPGQTGAVTRRTHSSGNSGGSSGESSGAVVPPRELPRPASGSIEDAAGIEHQGGHHLVTALWHAAQVRPGTSTGAHLVGPRLEV